MKVIIFTPSYFPRLNGMTYASHSHARALLNAGHEVHIICGVAGEDNCKEGIFVHRLEIDGSGLIWNPVRGDVDGVLHLVNSISPDVIISEGWYTWGTHLLPNIKLIGCKKMLISHGSADLRFFGCAMDMMKNVVRVIGYLTYNHIYFNRILKCLDSAAVLSFHKDGGRFGDYALFEREGIPIHKIANNSTYAISSRRLLPRIKVVSIIGEMSDNKNQMGAVDVLIKCNLVDVVNFVFPQENSYSKKVRSHSSSITKKAIKFISGKNREEIKNILDESCLVLVFSKTEAQPLVIIDGLALGIPYVATDVGCIPSMSGGVSCSIKNMHAEIDGILGNPTLYEQLSLRAVSYYRSEHSNNATDSAMVNFIHEGRN